MYIIQTVANPPKYLSTRPLRLHQARWANEWISAFVFKSIRQARECVAVIQDETPDVKFLISKSFVETHTHLSELEVI